MLCQPCLFHTFLFSLHSIPFDDPLQSFREFCSYLIIFIKHNILFYLIMTFSIFPNLRCPGVTKHGQNFESADQDWPDVPGFSFIFTYRSRTDCGIFPWHIYSPMTVLLASIDCLTCPRILLQNRHHFRPNPAVTKTVKNSFLIF